MHFTRLISLLFALCLLCVVGCRKTADNPDFHDARFDYLSDKYLYDAGMRHMNDSQRIDSALIYLSVLSNRINWPNKNPKHRDYCIAAMIQLARLHTYFIYDFSKAYTYLLKARDHAIIDKQYMVPYIDLNMANLYYNHGRMSKQVIFYSQALNKYKDVFNLIIGDSTQSHVLAPTFVNMIQVANEFDSIGSIKDYIARYSDSKAIESNYDLSRYADFLCKSMDAYLNGNPATSLTLIDSMRMSTQGPEFHKQQQEIVALGIRMHLLFNMSADITKPNQEILNTIIRIKNLSEHNKFEDAVCDAYYLLHKYYNNIGDTLNANLNLLKHYQAKERYLDSSNFYSIDRTSLSYEIEKKNDELNIMKNHKHIRDIYLTIAMVICLLLFTIVVVVYLNLKQTKRKNIILFEQNLKLINSEQPIAPDAALSSPNKNTEEDIAVKPCDKAIQEKYANVSISNDKSEIIAERINFIMQNSEELYKQDFSLSTLVDRISSELKDQTVNKTYISLVISQNMDTSFSTLLNDARIKEACRRFNNIEQYGNMTIEGIGQSVGYKSRSYFVTVFKKIVGMSPSSYQNIAKSKQPDRLLCTK